MQIDRMKKHLLDTVNVPGDYIDFGIFQGNTFCHLAAQADAWNRMAYGIAKLEGLDQPTEHDRNKNRTFTYRKGQFATNEKTINSVMTRFKSGNSYKILYGGLPEVLTKLPDTSYAFAVIDVVQYAPTKQALDYVWKRMSYGGTLYFDNYQPQDNSSCTKAINEFIKEHEEEIIVSRQMMINGVKEKELAIKCLREELRPMNWTKESMLTRPVTIATVLKTGGGVYDYKYVNNLVEGIKENLTIDHKIVCLTDDSSNFSDAVDEVIKFKHDYPKWWGKIELFRPEIFEGQQVFYFDLDTFIVGNLDEIMFYDGEFCALRDFYHLHTMGSGLMSWHGDRVLRIYDEFKANPKMAMDRFAGVGDQGWINMYRPSMDYFQDFFPNEVVSYKAHCVGNNNKVTVPKKAKIICFHGRPRPHEITDGLSKYWKQ